MREVPYWEPTNITCSHYLSQHSRQGNIAPGICAPVDYNLDRTLYFFLSYSFYLSFSCSLLLFFGIFSSSGTYLTFPISLKLPSFYFYLFYSCLKHAVCNFFLPFLLNFFPPSPSSTTHLFPFAQPFIHFLYLFLTFHLSVFQSSCPTAFSVSLFLPFLKE